MSGPSDESVAAEEKSLRVALESEIPLGDQKAWDIPMNQGAMPAGVIPRPDARNNPQTEMWSRLVSAVLAAILVGTILLLMLFTDIETLSRISGGGPMTVAGVVSIPGMMTGQLLAGESPSTAVRYQIVIFFLVAATTGRRTLTPRSRTSVCGSAAIRWMPRGTYLF